jgi:hypothetical protein
MARKKTEIPAELRSVKSNRLTNNNTVKEIITLKTKYPRMTEQQIANSVGRDRSTVNRALKRYNMDTKRVSEYNAAKSMLLSGIEEKLLSNVTQEKIDDASLKDLAVSYGIFNDKNRLEQGKATVITNLSDIVMLIDKDEKQKLIEISKGQYKVDDVSS